MPDRFPADEYGHHLVEEVRAGRMSRRDLIRRAGVFGLAVPGVSLLLAACGGSTTAGTGPSVVTGPPKRGGTLRVGQLAPTAAPDPVTMYDPGSIAVVQQVAEYLIWVNDDYTLSPQLATGWRPNADASVWTFQIRQGVTFHDGSPLTADDVVATFERLVNPSSNSSALTNFKGILAPGGTTKTGPYEVTFHLAKPFVDFPYTVASTNYNTVILPTGYAGGFVQKPVGTGPFQLTSYQTGASAAFARNPTYWQGGKPYLNGVQMTFYSSTSDAETALQGGTVDLVAGQPASGSPILTDPGIAILSHPSSYHHELFFRTDQAPFTDKRVRQAIALSLQRDAIIQNLYQGHAQLGNDEVFAPAFPNSPTIPQRSYDVAQARALLGQAGFPNGFSATLTTEQLDPVPTYATLVQSAAKAIGVNIQLNVESQSAFYGSGADQPWLSVPLGIVDWAARATPQQFFGSSYTTGAVWNSAHWSDPAYDQLAAQYEATLDQQTRTGIATQLATIQQDATPSIIAYWVDGVYTAAKNVQGLTPNGSYFIALTDAWLP